MASLVLMLMDKQQRARTQRKQTVRALHPPMGLEYTRACVRFARECNELVRAAMPMLLARYLETSGLPIPAERQDDLTDDLGRLLMVLRGKSAAFQTTIARMLQEVQQKHARDFVEAYGTTIPGINPLIGAEPWLREQMRNAFAENVRLISDIPEQLVGNVQRIITQGALNGLRPDDLWPGIAKNLDVSETRARLIARDQTAKWHSAVNRARQVDAGVTEYEWSTSADDRVRPTHRAHHGRRYKWAEAPSGTGHPGHDVNCRCAAIPVLPEFDESDDQGVDYETEVRERRARLEQDTAERARQKVASG